MGGGPGYSRTLKAPAQGQQHSLFQEAMRPACTDLFSCLSNGHTSGCVDGKSPPGRGSSCVCSPCPSGGVCCQPGTDELSAPAQLRGDPAHHHPLPEHDRVAGGPGTHPRQAGCALSGLERADLRSRGSVQARGVCGRLQGTCWSLLRASDSGTREKTCLEKLFTTRLCVIVLCLN